MADETTCTRCGGRGHEAAACATQAPAVGKKRARFCSACGAKGHTPEECTFTEEVAAHHKTHTDQQDTPADDDAVSFSDASTCQFCSAESGQECAEDDCLMASRRKNKIEKAKEATRKRRAVAARALTDKTATKDKSPPEGAASEDDAVAPLTAEDILKMPPTKIPTLHLKQIIFLVETWLPWIWNALPAERADRHSRLIAGLRQVLEFDNNGGGKVSRADGDRATRQLDEISGLLDPSVTGGMPTTVRPRILSAVRSIGMELVAYHDAKEYGWAVVRHAHSLHTASRQQPKEWRAALKTAAAAIAARSPGNGGRGGRGGGRGTGGRGRGDGSG